MAAWKLPLFGFKGEPAVARVEAPATDMGDAVTQMMAAQQATLRERFRGRAGYLRAQANLTDSIALKQELLVRAAENDWHLGQMGE